MIQHYPHPPFTQGLHRISDHCLAWLQPGGGFCLSNAGLVHDGGQSLLVDTLIDVPRTQAMVDAMGAATPDARPINMVFNTHAHPDHTAGNGVLPQARFYMTRRCADEYAHIQAMVANIDRLGGEVRLLMQELGADRFSKEGVVHVPPTDIFEGETSVTVGDLTVDIVELASGHTASDSVVHVPSDGVVFTGDLMFADCHLVLNAPAVNTWIRACETILAWGADTIVPGHGRVCGADEVRRHLDYLLFLKAEARLRYERGMDVDAAADDLFANLGVFSDLLRADLLYKNIAVLYAEFAGTALPGGFKEHMTDRWHFRNRLRGRAPGIFVNHVPDGN